MVNPYRIREFKPKDINKLTDFWVRNEYYKGISYAGLKKHLSWKYSPKFSKSIIAENESGIIGSCGKISTGLLSMGQKAAIGEWGMDSLVEQALGKNYRAFIFFRVFRANVFEKYRNSGNYITFSFPNNKVFKTYIKCGGIDVSNFFSYSRLLQTKDREFQTQFAGLAHNHGRFVHITRFNRKWDTLWSKLSSKFPLVNYRNAHFLNWRYFANPVRKYIVFLCVWGGDIKGYLVLRESARNKTKVGFIVDFLFDPAQHNANKLFIMMALRFFLRRKCTKAIIYSSHRDFKAIFNEMGFKAKKNDFLAISSNKVLLKRLLKDREKWFVTAGDGDFEMEL